MFSGSPRARRKNGRKVSDGSALKVDGRKVRPAALQACFSLSVFYGLFARWIPETTPADSGSCPSGVSGYSGGKPCAKDANKLRSTVNTTSRVQPTEAKAMLRELRMLRKYLEILNRIRGCHHCIYSTISLHIHTQAAAASSRGVLCLSPCAGGHDNLQHGSL